MASLVSTSLDIIRRHKTPKRARLHARWGDVAISAPIEGAWAQFENPYPREKVEYGPGFVPGCKADNDDCFNYGVETTDYDSHSKETGAIAALKSRRLTRILLPSSLNPSTPRKHQVQEKSLEFEYKPIHPDYTQEVAEKLDQENAPRFRYVPASQKYLRDLATDLEPDHEPSKLPPSRSRSCDPSTGERYRQGYQPGSLESSRNNSPKSEPVSLPGRSSRGNSISRVRDESRGRHQQKKTELSLLSRSRSAVKPHRKRMTLTMVSDPDDLW